MEARAAFSPLERFAVKITHGVGTVGFFFLLVLWTGGWLLWNLYGPLEMRFDPAPAFVIWLFTSNIIQLVLLPLVMVGQNLEGKFAEHRAQAKGEWMTTDFVPFTAQLKFGQPSLEKGLLILRKDNPSGLAENDEQLIVPVKISNQSTTN